VPFDVQYLMIVLYLETLYVAKQFSCFFLLVKFSDLTFLVNRCLPLGKLMYIFFWTWQAGLRSLRPP